MPSNNPGEEVPPNEYPSGHLNHLTAENETALEEFKALCQEDGCYGAPDYSSKATHDDETLLRFLRARKFVPKDAFQQFKATQEWRKEQEIDGLYNTIDVDEYEQTRLLYTHWTGRRDRRGIPLYVFVIGDLDSKKMSAYEQSTSRAQDTDGKLSPKLRRLFATYEHFTSFVMPLCSSVPSRPFAETPISQSCNIVDISGVGIRQFWSLKGHLQSASTLATAHYPETLGRTFIIGAPSFFPTVWNWLKYWFDQNTVSKFVILSDAEVKSILEKYIKAEDIPKRYGGKLEWEFGQLPDLDPEILEILEMPDGAMTLPKGPIRWKESEDGTKIEAHALGSVGGKRRDDVVACVSRHVFAKSLHVFGT